MMRLLRAYRVGCEHLPPVLELKKGVWGILLALCEFGKLSKMLPALMLSAVARGARWVNKQTEDANCMHQLHSELSVLGTRWEPFPPQPPVQRGAETQKAKSKAVAVVVAL